jgi:hypothetical protein
MNAVKNNYRTSLKEVVRQAGEDALFQSRGTRNVITAQTDEQGNIVIDWYTEPQNVSIEREENVIAVASWSGMEDFDISNEDAQTFKMFRFARHENLHAQTVAQINNLIQAGNMADATNEMVSLEMKLKQELAEGKIDQDEYESFYHIHDEEYHQYLKEIMWGYETIYEQFLQYIEEAEATIERELL